MDDVENVIKKLSDVSAMLFQMYRDETDKENISIRYDQFLAVDNALDLLKEQQPKVIELLDLYDSEGMQGYIETRKSIRPCFLVHHLQ